MRALLLLSGLLAALASPPTHAAPTPPPLPALSAGQQMALGAGEVVIVEGTPSAIDGGIRTVGIVEISASTERVWAAVLDLQARVDGASSIEGASVYDAAQRGDARTWGVRWEMEVLGVDLAFHNRYTLWRDAGYAEFALDPARENDIAQTAGSYTVTPAADGARTRFVYVSDTNPGRLLPDAVVRSFARNQVERLMTDVADRATPGVADSGR